MSGNSIVRDIIIPKDMPLHNLHYAIQKLFGWQNSHLRRFYLPKEDHLTITKGTVKGCASLVGTVFQPPSESESDIFWDDYYQGGSFGLWLKKRYTGPYHYGGKMEYLETAQEDINKVLELFSMIDVKEPFESYWKRKEVNEDATLRILRRAPLAELSLEELHSSLLLDNDTESLLERLEVNQVLAYSDEKLHTDSVFPLSKELIYNYDFGDNWIVSITKYNHYHDLLDSNRVGVEEIEAAKEEVLTKYKPVCIYKEGLSIMDDIGGLGNYADFLGEIYEGENKEEIASSRSWARYMGWSSKKVSIKKML